MTRTDVLEYLCKPLWLFGTANDADDHNCGPEGTQLRARAAAEIRELIRDHPFVVEVLPGLERELETRHIEGFGWSNLVDALERESGVARPFPFK
jgi:hypothetical protein